MKKVISIFGTRPEATKMAPLVLALAQDPDIDAKILVTAQHREMLDQVLDLFDIVPDYDLDLMTHGQTPSQVTAKVLVEVEEIFKKEAPDLILVHGDTATTMAAALAAFYQKIPVGHVEAGLRTYNKYSPYPEEMNRVLTGHLADLHFAPTERNKRNLLAEGIKEENIYITGNTAVDALMMKVDPDYEFEDEFLKTFDFDQKDIILVTAHRRENLGEPMRNIFRAIKEIADDFPRVEVIYPIHLNPKVREIANEILQDHDRIHLIEPLSFEPFVNLQYKSKLIMSDSGGIQEEAPSIGKPVLVLRTETERPEAIEAGTIMLAGIEKDRIYDLTKTLLTDEKVYNRMAKATNPYGTGQASREIVKNIKKFLKIM